MLGYCIASVNLLRHSARRKRGKDTVYTTLGTNVGNRPPDIPQLFLLKRKKTCYRCYR